MVNAPVYLDTATWPRRDAYEHFRRFDKPYFNVCTRVDAAPLKAALDGRGGFALALYHLALRLCHEQQPMRLRLEAGRVRVYDSVDGSTTVLREDGSFGYAPLPWNADFRRFAAAAEESIAAVRQHRLPFDPRVDETAVVHFTTLPWIHFTSFSHARNWGREDSVPKFAFGRADRDGVRLWVPMSVEVHHALLDGLHLGRYVQAFEAAMAQPQDWLGA